LNPTTFIIVLFFILFVYHEFLVLKRIRRLEVAMVDLKKKSKT